MGQQGQRSIGSRGGHGGRDSRPGGGVSGFTKSAHSLSTDGMSAPLFCPGVEGAGGPGFAAETGAQALHHRPSHARNLRAPIQTNKIVPHSQL